MLEPGVVQALAAEYDEAERTRLRLRPATSRHPGMTIEDAYEIQQAWVDMKVARGGVIRGHKIGLTSKAMQNISGLGEPDYGTLLQDMFFDDGAEIPTHRFITPRVECEIAFVLGKPLKGPNCTLFDVLSATDYVVPAVEIIDLRTLDVDPETGATRKVADNIADNAANAGLVLGGRPVRPMDFDIRWAPAICMRNAVIEESGVAAAVMNHPGNGVAWLANKLARHDVGLAAGEVVLGGSFTRVVPARPGDVFNVDFGPFGSVNLSFSRDT
jgi:2-oxo-hept-3-ene-1,7-dioate hydratase